MLRCILAESARGSSFRLRQWRSEVRTISQVRVTDCKDVESSLWKGGNARDPRVELEMRALLLEQESTGLKYRWTPADQMPADGPTKGDVKVSLYL